MIDVFYLSRPGNSLPTQNVSQSLERHLHSRSTDVTARVEPNSIWSSLHSTGCRPRIMPVLFKAMSSRTTGSSTAVRWNHPAKVTWCGHRCSAKLFLWPALPFRIASRDSCCGSSRMSVRYHHPHQHLTRCKKLLQYASQSIVARPTQHERKGWKEAVDEPKS